MRSTMVSLNSQSEYGDYAVHGFVFPPDGAAAVGGVVPIARAGRVQTGTVLLHDHARH